MFLHKGIAKPEVKMISKLACILYALSFKVLCLRSFKVGLQWPLVMLFLHLQ